MLRPAHGFRVGGFPDFARQPRSRPRCRGATSRFRRRGTSYFLSCTLAVFVGQSVGGVVEWRCRQSGLDRTLYRIRKRTDPRLLGDRRDGGGRVWWPSWMRERVQLDEAATPWGLYRSGMVADTVAGTGIEADEGCSRVNECDDGVDLSDAGRGIGRWDVAERTHGHSCHRAAGRGCSRKSRRIRVGRLMSCRTRFWEGTGRGGR